MGRPLVLPPGVLTTAGAARLLNVSQQTVIKMCDRGMLKHWKVPLSRFRRIMRADAVAFAEQHGIPVREDSPCDS